MKVAGVFANSFRGLCCIALRGIAMHGMAARCKVLYHAIACQRCKHMDASTPTAVILFFEGQDFEVFIFLIAK